MVFYPISFGFILIVALFFGCPIVALGIKIAEIFDFFVGHVIEFSIIAFIICFVVALIWYLVKRNLVHSLFIFLDCPMFAVFITFMIAEFLKKASGGIIEAIVAFVLYSIFSLIGLAVMAALTFFGPYCLTVIPATDKKHNYKSSSILIDLLIMLVSLILQVLILVFFVV